MDKNSLYLANVIKDHPDYEVRYIINIDDIVWACNQYPIRVCRVLVDKVTEEIDKERLYLRDYDKDNLREDPYNEYCGEDYDKWTNDEEFERWLDTYEWHNAIVVFMRRE